MQGRKVPIATRVKTDRLGLGIAPRQPLAVTHSGEELVTGRRMSRAEARRLRGEAKASPEALRAAESNRQYAHEQAWRREMLRYLNS